MAETTRQFRLYVTLSAGLRLGFTFLSHIGLRVKLGNNLKGMLQTITFCLMQSIVQVPYQDHSVLHTVHNKGFSLLRLLLVQ